jgi:hypothetical protein
MAGAPGPHDKSAQAFNVFDQELAGQVSKHNCEKNILLLIFGRRYRDIAGL